MKKLKIVGIVPFVVVMVLLVSCGSKKALDYNNKMVAVQKSLLSEGEAIEKDTVSDFRKMELKRDITKAKINAVNEILVPDGGADFKKAMLDDFQTLYDVFDALIKSEQEQDNDSLKTSLREKGEELQSRLHELDQNVIDEQRKFAKKYNFKLQ